MQLDSNQKAFFELLRAGLWEKEARLSQFNDIDYSAILQLAEEQSVVGLITAGLEHVNDVRVSQEEFLQFVGSSLQIEQQNKAMNVFVAKLIEQLRKEDIYAVLVKGQGIAQCYERPLWRLSGDVDLLLSASNYERAKGVLIPQAVEVEHEFKAFKHLGMTMEGGFVVELHGTMHSRISSRIDKGVDEAQRDVFYGGNVRSWVNEGTSVFLPAPNDDVIFIFTHILNHYFIDGIGIRQICDWCRLLWTYRDSLDHRLLEKRIRKMGLLTEWKAFGAFAVDYLGIPVEAMPFFGSRFKAKGAKIMSFVLESGNFGHNKTRKYSDSYIEKKILALWHKFKNFCCHLTVFPLDTIKFFCCFVLSGLDAVSRKE